jgi:hypothetical protein
MDLLLSAIPILVKLIPGWPGLISRLGPLRQFARKGLICLAVLVAKWWLSRKVDEIPGSAGIIGKLGSRPRVANFDDCGILIAGLG